MKSSEVEAAAGASTVGEAIEAADHIRHTLESKINHHPAKKGTTHVGK